MPEDREPVVRITDALGHDVLTETERYTRGLLEWLDLEAAAGELTPGLAEMREMLREDVEEIDD